ncbi:hypothetical protein GTW51_20090 [Aurantimonas aggregata]|uniref:MxaK protein n=1 Tax=Aurantimonas aggregata TaxID=2047720 RepID=A0A6L9MMP7_9HYPH|nr:hypothetical protein [Aurantimonas aggregata]NDV88985.1 hypothetical protein [Aurantimonas aggregata]
MTALRVMFSTGETTTRRKGRRLMTASLRDSLQTGLFAIALICLFAFAAYQTLSLLQAWQANRSVHALASGAAVSLDEDAPAEVVLAATYRHLRLRDVAAAEALGPRFQAYDSPDVEAAYRFAIANARMNEAFDQITANQIDEATVTVRLAQQDYRAAMRLVPGDFDLKYNFDIASRLVRVFPRPAIEPEEEGQRPRDVWTDLPGVPRGLP